MWARRVADHRRELPEMIEKQQEAVDAYQANVAAGRTPRGPAPSYLVAWRWTAAT